MAERFSPDGRWYYTGDAGQIDADGHIYFSARDDDVIIMAGYRIGPFEVESSLSEHPAVAESAVIGVPDELRGEAVQAHVVLRDPTTASDELAAELQQHVKRNYAAHAYPRTVHFVNELPRPRAARSNASSSGRRPLKDPDDGEVCKNRHNVRRCRDRTSRAPA